MTNNDNNSQFVDSVLPIRSPSSSEKAFTQIRSGFGWIVFHHFRKAAGSSVTSFLLRVIAEISGVIPHKKGSPSEPAQTNNRIENFIEAGSINFYHQEWGAFPADCLSDAHEPPAVLVTAIREPLSRILSEFNYAGPGSKINSHTYDEIVTTWNDWISCGPGDQAGSIPRGSYINNFYTRSLIGNCHAEHINTPPTDYVPYYGNRPPHIRTFGGGCPVEYEELTTSDLELAKQVLQSFDLVLIVERLKDNEVADWTCSAFGVPREKIGYFEVHNAKKPFSNGHNTSPYIPDEIEHLLRKENSFDLELYQFARRLFDKRLLKWKQSDTSI